MLEALLLTSARSFGVGGGLPVDLPRVPLSQAEVSTAVASPLSHCDKPQSLQVHRGDLLKVLPTTFAIN